MDGQSTVPVDPDAVKANRLASNSERCKPDLSMNLRLSASMSMPGEGCTRVRNHQV